MKRIAILCMLLLPSTVQAQEFVFDPYDPFDDNFKTGVSVGDTIPSFSLPDAYGKTWDFESLKGPKGALLLFHRSADW